MKTGVLVFVCLLLNVPAHSQRLNGQGLKMVSKIVVDSRVESEVIEYSYDTDNRLCGIVSVSRKSEDGADLPKSKDVHTQKDVYELKNGALKRTIYYDGKLVDDFVYEYVMNTKGYITKCRERYKYNDGSKVEWEMNFNYYEDGRTLMNVTNEMIRNGVSGEKNTLYMSHSDGNVTIGTREQVFDDYINDTNINLNVFFMETHTNGVPFSLWSKELTGEWVNVWSRNLLARSGSRGRARFMTYEYDENNNLVKIDVLVRDIHLNTIQIYYLN